MEEVSNDSDCKICKNIARGPGDNEVVIYEDETWIVKAALPSTLAGWVQLQTKRHVSDLAAFNDTEAGTLGSVLCKVERALIEASGAERIYIASLCEGTHHFHTHLVPRYSEMPMGAIGFEAFGLRNLVRKGDVEAANVDQTREVLSRAKDILNG
jgi:diadenosine tetraphosphate (Ap4A) HIT family hydrolase